MMMRARLMTTVAAIAIATPAFAADLYAPYVPPAGDPVYSPQPMVVGHIDLGIGFVDFDSDTVGAFVGAGRVNIPFGGTWNVELETGGGALFDDGNSFSTIGAAGHVWTKLNNAAVGVYGGVNFPSSITVYTLGLEGEAYLGNFTLGANADYNWVDGSGDAEFWTVRGYADAYLTPDWRIGGALSYLDITSGGSGDLWSATLDTEYRFSGTPLSVWGDVSYADAGNGGDDAWGGMIGFRVFMDGAGTTLQQHDREVPWDSGLVGNRLFGF